MVRPDTQTSRSGSPTRRAFRAGFAALLALEVACVGDIGGGGPGDGGTPSDATTTTGNHPDAEVGSSALRRLSAHELARTLHAAIGVVPEAIERLPPDSLGHSFDRVVNDQTMSPAHYEAYAAIAGEVATSLIAERRLDELASGCPDESVPSLVRAVTKNIAGAALTLSPEWAVSTPSNPQHAQTVYAPDPQAVYNHNFDVPGSYELRFQLSIQGPVDTAQVIVDGQVVATAQNLNGAQTVVAPIEITEAGSHVIELSLQTTPDDSGLRVVFEGLAVEGPLSDAPEPPAAAVAACAQAIIDELAPTAFRRPLADEEAQRLAAAYETISAAYAPVDGLVALLEGIFSSPHFVFLVEVGEPVADRPGYFRLGPWELASRLSYAICEGPPDAILYGAAAAGELSTPEQIEAQARRLFGEPCARDTVERFLEHWLWLNRLPDLTKSQAHFPEFDDQLREGMVVEAKTYLSELVWKDDASVADLLDSDRVWANAETASYYGMTSADGQASTLPPERAGILTSPGVLAVTGDFEGTSPVKRGIYVLGQILCTELPPPPADLAVTPPLPDPNLTTRERWAAHSDDPACSSCHQVIDPVGFAFEEFDGIGRHRTEENGHPIDASGGVPTIGVEDGEIVGGAALAKVLAESDEMKSCVAKQWLRFSFGRLETAADEVTIGSLAAALDTESLREAFITIVTTDAFVHRTEDE
jgi:hypothetical protein